MEVAVVVAAVVAVYQEFRAFLVVLAPRDQLVGMVPQGREAMKDPRGLLVHQEERAAREIKEAKVLLALRVLQDPWAVPGNSAFLKI